MNSFFFSKSALAALLLIAGYSTAYANSTIWIDDSAGNIETVDANTGSTTLIGNSGVGLTDIAFAGNQLYGIDFNSLYQINTNTGAASLIGSLNLNSDVVNGLEYGNGVLYASSASGELYSVNVATGNATGLFNTGVSSGGDIAFHDGLLYYTDAASTLFSINLNTDVTTTIGATGVSAIFGLANGSDDTLYAAASNGIYALNTASGAATQTSTDNLVSGIAYGATAPIPEPEQWLMLLAGFAVLGLSKTRKQTA